MPESRAVDPRHFGQWNQRVAAQKHEPVHWIWEGFIPYPGVTLLTGASMVGKTTLLAMLLDRRRAGGLLLGKSVLPGTTVVISEEDISLWARRQQQLDFGPCVCFDQPELHTFCEWRRYMDGLKSLYAQIHFELLVIDSLAAFVPVAENHARSLRKALDELRFLGDLSFGVLLLHHPRRAGGRTGHAARGSGALPALAQVSLDMRLPPGDPFTRRRQLFGVGRYPETPQRLLIEMNPQATDYAIGADPDQDAAFAPVLDTLTQLLHQAASPLTRQQILDGWPHPATRPAPNTLWRWLARACDLGLLARSGEGNKAEAYRYAVAGPSVPTAPPGVPAIPDGTVLDDPVVPG
jgi:hypothetical protein